MSSRIIQWYKNTTDCLAIKNNISVRAYDDYPRVTCCCNLDNKQAGKFDLEFLNSVKRSLDAGNRPSECQHCWKDEDQGLMSERIRYQSTTGASDSSSNDYFNFSVKFSNLCPLYCRSCDGNDSSAWADVTKTNHLIADAFKQDLTDDLESWEFITTQIKQLSTIHGDKFYLNCIGGETAIQPGFFRLVNWLKENNLQSQIKIRLTTSLTAGISDDFLNQLTEFKSISMMLSIDSVNENYELVRNPAKFSKVKSNLDKLVDVYRREQMIDPGKFELWVSPVFSLNNIFYIEEYISWWQSWIKRNQIDPKFANINLHSPVHLTINILPRQYRNALLEILDRCMTYDILQRSNFFVMKTWLETTIESLRLAPEMSKEFEYFLKFTADFDKRSGVSSLTNNKKLFDILSKEHREIYDRYYIIVDVNKPIGQSR